MAPRKRKATSPPPRPERDESNEATNSQQQAQPTQTDADVENEILQYYGQPGDGLQVTSRTTVAEFQELQRQFIRRATLAQLVDQPDNGVARHQYRDNLVTFHLRNPPNVDTRRNRQGGTLSRVSTTRAPSTEEWQEYHAWCRQRFLPPWFFTERHLALLEPDNEERRRLDLDMTAGAQPIADLFAGRPITEAARVFLPAAQDVRGFEDAVTRAGGFLNIPYLPAARGRWDWATTTDRTYAHSLRAQLNEPHDVAVARVRRHLPFPVNRLPNVIWFPEQRFMNPQERPDGVGRFEYHTQDDADLASLNYGGAGNGHGLADNPTAQDMWLVRHNRPSLAAAGDINVVWIPGQVGMSNLPPPRVPRASSPADHEDPGRTDLLSGLNPITLVRDELISVAERAVRGTPRDPTPVEGPDLPYGSPTNGDRGGQYDQTSRFPDGAIYTKLLNRRTTSHRPSIVVDRSRAKLGEAEPHKEYILGLKGWLRYPRHATINWEDKKNIQDLNHWRDKQYKTMGFTQKGDVKADYTDEERAWVTDFVRRHPNLPNRNELRERFYIQFPTPEHEKRTAQAMRKFFVRTQTQGGSHSTAESNKRKAAARKATEDPPIPRPRGKAKALARKENPTTGGPRFVLTQARTTRQGTASNAPNRATSEEARTRPPGSRKRTQGPRTSLFVRENETSGSDNAVNDDNDDDAEEEDEEDA